VALWPGYGGDERVDTEQGAKEGYPSSLRQESRAQCGPPESTSGQREQAPGKPTAGLEARRDAVEVKADMPHVAYFFPSLKYLRASSVISDFLRSIAAVALADSGAWTNGSG
jgi:hypothetical protein